MRARLANAERHACHAAIAPLPAGAPVRITEESRADGLARLAVARDLWAELDGDRARRKLPDLDALAASDPYFRRAVARLAALEAYIAAVRAVQAHLACDRLLGSRPLDGAYTWQTSNAVESFQRGAMILPTGVLDDATRAALATASGQRDFATALRVLRARVAAATGLVEDGTAGAGRQPVLGLALEPEATWRVAGYPPAADAAPDLVSAATEAAARALGWTDAPSTLAFLDALSSPELAGVRFVAVALPPVPAYHAPEMELSVEIDRGDVWRTAPAPSYPVGRRPALVLYAAEDERKVALVRWPTTIGGWQLQQLGGDLANTESPDFSETLSQKAIQNIPINNRRWSALAMTTPGVVADTSGFGLVSIRGISTVLNNVEIDGADDNDAYYSEERGRTREAYSTSGSAVREFAVNTGVYSAEYGRAAGGVITSVDAAPRRPLFRSGRSHLLPGRGRHRRLRIRDAPALRRWASARPDRTLRRSARWDGPGCKGSQEVKNGARPEFLADRHGVLHAGMNAARRATRCRPF